MIKRFLNLINKRKPIFVCVNDDWPIEESKYNEAMSIFNGDKIISTNLLIGK